GGNVRARLLILKLSVFSAPMVRRGVVGLPSGKIASVKERLWIAPCGGSLAVECGSGNTGQLTLRSLAAEFVILCDNAPLSRPMVKREANVQRDHVITGVHAPRA